jgi:hypothetical protein
MYISHATLKFSKIYSSDYDFKDEKSGRQISGTSYKAQIIDEEEQFQLVYKITEECFKMLGLEKEENVEKLLKKSLLVDFQHVPALRGGFVVDDVKICSLNIK